MAERILLEAGTHTFDLAKLVRVRSCLRTITKQGYLYNESDLQSRFTLLNGLRMAAGFMLSAEDEQLSYIGRFPNMSYQQAVKQGRKEQQYRLGDLTVRRSPAPPFTSVDRKIVEKGISAQSGNAIKLAEDSYPTAFIVPLADWTFGLNNDAIPEKLVYARDVHPDALSVLSAEVTPPGGVPVF